MHEFYLISINSLIYDYLCNECLTPLIKSCSGEVFLIQHNVTKFDSDLRQVSGFLLPMIYHTRGEYVNHYSTDAVS
jgi:hypothetical protein